MEELRFSLGVANLALWTAVFAQMRYHGPEYKVEGRFLLLIPLVGVLLSVAVIAGGPGS